MDFIAVAAAVLTQLASSSRGTAASSGGGGVVPTPEPSRKTRKRPGTETSPARRGGGPPPQAAVEGPPRHRSPLERRGNVPEQKPPLLAGEGDRPQGRWRGRCDKWQQTDISPNHGTKNRQIAGQNFAKSQVFRENSIAARLCLPFPRKNLPCSQGRGTALKGGGEVVPTIEPSQKTQKRPQTKTSPARRGGGP